jgi:hypothetical protein
MCSAGKTYLARNDSRFDMPEFHPRLDWVREMKRFGILPQNHDPAAPLDCYATERKYWESLWYHPAGSSAGSPSVTASR